jgi:hypothetical protein
VLLLELATALPLLTLDSLSLSERQHLLVLDPQLSPMQLKMIHGVYDLRRLLGCSEVGESQTSEDSIVEVVIEGVWERQPQISHQLHQLFLLHCERNVLDNNGGRDQFFIDIMRKIFLS